eukprot:scaffold6814_cov23-Tisochrysis_lutea.AAC.1
MSARRRAAFRLPSLQSLAVHMCSVAVGVAMDLRWRHLYVHACSRQEGGKHSTSPAVPVPAAAGAEGVAKAKAN